MPRTAAGFIPAALAAGDRVYGRLRHGWIRAARDAAAIMATSCRAPRVAEISP
jgi:hypothetical protein